MARPHAGAFFICHISVICILNCDILKEKQIKTTKTCIIYPSKNLQKQPIIGQNMFLL